MIKTLKGQRGSVVLVGLMLTVILGIVLSSYISLCTNALQLSQREYQSNRALQMAENGMEEALWALNQTGTTGFVDAPLDGGTIDWTLFSATGIATATITGLPAEGNVTRKIGIRVLNYATPTAAVPAWSNSTSYGIGDYATININGTPTKCCCATPNIGQSPVSSNWNSTTAYPANAYVSYGGVLYRCKAANTGMFPEKSGYWTPIWINGQIISAEGVITFADGTEVRRQVRAITTIAQQSLPNALAAVNGGSISLNSTAAVIDSYDSTLGPYAAASATYSAVVAGRNVDIKSTTVKGYVAKDSTGILSFSADGYILAPSDTAVRNPSRIITTTLTSPAPVSAPSTPPFPTMINNWGPGDGVNPIYIGWTPVASLNAGTYLIPSDLNIGGNGWLTINGPGTVKLIIPDNLYVGGKTAIDAYRWSWNNPPYSANTAITPGVEGITVDNNAKLELYVGGDLAVYAGGINNLSLNPANVTIYGTAPFGSPTWDIRTDQKFYGTINAPRANLTIYHDTGIPNADFFGAALARNIYLRGGASVHYDLALRNSSPSGTNIPASRSLILWRELANSSEPEFFTFNYP